MRVVQAVWGVFHHFDLARELEQRGHLQKVYSTFPWARLKREGIAHSKVETFPWLHMAQFAAGRFAPGWRWASDAFGYANTIMFDKWLNSQLPNHGIDALIALSGAGLNTGQRLQKQGGIFICDRGSTHQRVQTPCFSRSSSDGTSIYPRVDLRTRCAIARRPSTRPRTPSRFLQVLPPDLSSTPASPKEKVHVIPYGVRLENFRKVADPPRHQFEVIFVGSVSLRKGVPYLLGGVFAGLRHQNKRLRIIGALQPEMESVLTFLPLIRLSFWGSQPQSRLQEFMSGSHVYGLPD